jgi:glutamine amidotransferase of anthranilate synthase or aminodeoxychorismate synthase
MVVIIDNYDSFTYNLYQITGEYNPDVTVVYNDQVGVAEIEAMKPTHIIISPGPGRPKDAGICEEAIRYFAGKVPILGICLGHQAICEAFGAQIGYAKTMMHGKKSPIHIANGNPVFHGLAPVLEVGRYHSLAAERETLPDELLIVAETDDGEIMGVKHRDYSICGLQFHPESILTSGGRKMIENFLQTEETNHD